MMHNQVSSQLITLYKQKCYPYNTLKRRLNMLKLQITFNHLLDNFFQMRMWPNFGHIRAVEQKPDFCFQLQWKIRRQNLKQRKNSKENVSNFSWFLILLIPIIVPGNGTNLIRCRTQVKNEFYKRSLGKATLEYRLTRTHDRFSNIRTNKKNCKLWGVKVCDMQ
jgi:hypothetical protein